MIFFLALCLMVAKTPQEKVQGLSSRESLPEECGMIFLYEEPTRPSFWMQDMRFDLDFIWLRDGRVVEITRNVPADSPDSYRPSVPIDAVIEVNAGYAKHHNIQIGDRITSLSDG